MAAATQFMTEKMYVFVTPLIKLLLSLVVGVFYVVTLSCIIAILNDKKSRN